MQVTLSLILAILPLLSSGSPLQQEAGTSAGTKIPIFKRSNLVNSDGTVDIDALRNQLQSSIFKFQRGIDTYERNTGRSHSLQTEGYDEKRATGSDVLTDANNVLWYGQISVGTPAQTYTVQFDTGSSDLFLPGPQCTENCQGHKIYNPSKSSTSSNIGHTFMLMYGDGSSVEGEQYIDTVAIAGLIAKKQRLGVATQYSSGFSPDNFPADGLLGMGFKSISDYNANPVFQDLVSSHRTDQPVFAFKLAEKGSELFLGGTNRALYTGSFTYTPVTEQGYWQVVMNSVSVNNQNVASRLAAIIDTGTTLVIGDDTSVTALYNAIPGSKDASDTVGSGFYTVPCSAIPTVSLNFGGKPFPISPSIFNLGRLYEGSSDCVGGVVSSGMEKEFWIVGDIFLRNVYTVFDFGNTRVGFASLRS